MLAQRTDAAAPSYLPFGQVYMTRLSTSLRLLSAAAILLTAGALSACDAVSFTASATEPWSRHYTLKEGGSLDIRNTNGKTEVLAGDGNAIDVTATKTARAMSDNDAKEALKDIQITESVTPDRVSLDSSSQSPALEVMVSHRVDYVVHVPRWANVEVRATNGEIRVRDIAGSFKATATNGVIDAAGLSGAATASATNGRVALAFDKVGDGEISGRTTNGTISLTLPPSAKTTLTATVTNGGISTDGIDLAVSEKSRRRLEGTTNGGGTPIHLSTTNGGITVRAK
jgi:hypothetical protein